MAQCVNKCYSDLFGNKKQVSVIPLSSMCLGPVGAQLSSYPSQFYGNLSGASIMFIPH